MEIMLNELALSVTPLDSSWYATSHPADATTCEAKERHIANMFWWDVLRSPVIQRIEPASNPRHPDILWRFYIPVGSWNSRHKCCSHRTIVPALNKFQREIVRRFNGLIASLRVSVTPCVKHGCPMFGVVMLASLGSLVPVPRIKVS